MAQIDSSSENTKIYDEAQVQRYLKASVELAIGDGEYQVGMVNELEKNIVSYCTKKLNSHIQKPHKYIVTCSIVQNKGAGFHVFSSTHWDQKTDGMVSYQFENKSVIILVTAYILCLY